MWVNRIPPETRACGGSRRNMASEVIDLPDPDSPTSPSTSPAPIEKLRSRTAIRVCVGRAATGCPAARRAARLVRCAGNSIFNLRTSSKGCTTHGSSASKKRPCGRWTAEGGCPYIPSYCPCPRIRGSPFLLLPITTTLVLALLARVSVASIPFHSSSEGVIPCATICWKSRTPAASMRLR